MSANFPQQLTALCSVLATHPAPQTPAEALNLTGEALLQALGQARLLFYLEPQRPPLERLVLNPCPGYYLAPDIFFYDAANKTDSFIFRTSDPYWAPLTLAAIHHLGFLFVEKASGCLLTEVEQKMVQLLATQTAHHLDHLRRNNLLAPANLNGEARVVIDEAHCLVRIDDITLSLSSRELAAFQLLYRHRGDTCSRDLLDAVIYPDETTIPNRRNDRLDMLVYRLRAKLKCVADSKVVIETVRGLGYCLRLGEIER